MQHPRAWRNESRTSGSSTCSTTAPTEKSSGGRPVPVRTARNSLPAPRRIDSAAEVEPRAASLSSVSAVSSSLELEAGNELSPQCLGQVVACLGSLSRISVMFKRGFFTCLEMSALASSHERLRCEGMLGAKRRCSRERQAFGIGSRRPLGMRLETSRNPVSASECEAPRHDLATERVSQPVPLREDRASLLLRGGPVAAGPQTGVPEKKLHPTAFDRLGIQQTFSTAGYATPRPSSLSFVSRKRRRSGCSSNVPLSGATIPKPNCVVQNQTRALRAEQKLGEFKVDRWRNGELAQAPTQARLRSLIQLLSEIVVQGS